MYIAPNSKIYILKNIPLDPTYDHTLYWSIVQGDEEPYPNSKAAQSQYFIDQTKYTLTAQSYQRLKRGWMRIEILSDNLYDCNYLMFQNTSFGNKWFYAFIKSVEYINNNVSEIEFEIDVMQTWWFDYDLETCFVEREHTTRDRLFEHIVSEDLYCGDEYISVSQSTFDMNDMAVGILANKTTQSTHVAEAQQTRPSRIFDNILIGCAFFSVPMENTSASLQNIENILTQSNLPQEIVTMYQFPRKFWNGGQEPQSYEETLAPNISNIGGYTPKNKKLFCYPYNFLAVSNNSGQTANYKWEDWYLLRNGFSDDITFTIEAAIATTPAVICYPQAYRGISEDYDDGIVYSNFPMCAWEADSFKAWWAQNKNSFVTSTLTSAFAAASTGIMATIGGGAILGAGMATGSPIAVAGGERLIMAGVTQGVTQTAQTIGEAIGKYKDMKVMPNQTLGHVQTDSLNAASGRVRFDFYKMTIKEDYARIIDDYFTRYGYACKRNKIPNRNARAHWTYTKTAACTIKGTEGMPANDAVKICSIYDNGITFWNNPDEVGDYSLDNTPIES